MSAIDLDRLRTWIGRSETRTELLAVEPAAALAATLDRDPGAFRNGTPLPPAFHWIYFPSIHAQSELGADGHPVRGGFLPPVPLPRRMWASCAVEIKAPLLLGSVATQTVTIEDVTAREGRSGSLVFVKLRYVVADATGAVAIEETRQTVYRDDARQGSAGASTAAPVDETWSRSIVPDPVLLFRYSAITLNNHRIHYDRPYATQVEGYPSLVVHGPLVTTMLLDEAIQREPGASIARFEMRAMRPLFEGRPFSLCGKREPESNSLHLWSRDDSGAQCTDARAWLR